MYPETKIEKILFYLEVIEENNLYKCMDISCNFCYFMHEKKCKGYLENNCNLSTFLNLSKEELYKYDEVEIFEAKLMRLK